VDPSPVDMIHARVLLALLCDPLSPVERAGMLRFVTDRAIEIRERRPDRHQSAQRQGALAQSGYSLGDLLREVLGEVIRGERPPLERGPET
jgi:hypothetical protein